MTIALAVPTPPAHVAIPVQLADDEPPPPPAPVETLPPAPARSRETARTSDRPAAPATPPATAPEPAPSAPNPVLQTTADPTQVAQRTQSLINQASQDLGQIRPRYKTLSTQGRAQFDMADAFITKAKQALDLKNYPYAEQLAIRAAALASALVKG